jgi:hypothetical protein
MISPATLFLGVINSSFSVLSLLWLIPIAVIIYLDIQLVYYGIKKGGGLRGLGLIVSFILSVGAGVWGLWSVFTDFSLSLLFVAMGGGILLLFSFYSLTATKEDLKHHR